MNKLFTKIATAIAGFAMVVGVGIGIANSNREAKPIYASGELAGKTGTITFGSASGSTAINASSVSGNDS